MLDKIVFPSETVIQSDIKLKPCPFCGNEPTLQQDTRYPEELDDRPVKAYEVVCKTSGCIIYNCDNNYYLSVDDAIEGWNWRAEQ